MKERSLVLILSLTFILSVGLYLIVTYFFAPTLLLAPPPNTLIPQNCGSQGTQQPAIQTVWDTIFGESSGGINLVGYFNDCRSYLSYKRVGDNFYILTAYYNSSNNITKTSGLHIQTSPIYSNTFENNAIQSYTVGTDFENYLLNAISAGGFFEIGELGIARSHSISDSSGAHFAFIQIFDIDSPGQTGWSLTNNLNIDTEYSFTNQTAPNKTLREYVFANYIFEMIRFTEPHTLTQPSCTESWQQINTTCDPVTNNKTIWYNDTNSCGTTANLPTGFYGNGTSHSCTTSCIQNWAPLNTSCLNGALTQYWNDTNMCNNVTGMPPNQTFSCTTKLHLPVNCSTSEIKSTWDSIYFENSTGITIITNDSQTFGCKDYFAYKIKPQETFVFAGYSNGSSNQQLYALQGNLTSAANSNITRMNQSLINQRYQMGLFILLLSEINKTGNPRQNITSAQQASSIFNSVFALKNSSNFVYNNAEESYHFELNQTTPQIENLTTGYVPAKYDLKFYSNSFFSICTPTWTAQNTTCLNGNLTQYWIDTTCNLNPETNGHANQTLSCSTCANWTAQNSACRTDDTILTSYTNTNASCTTPGNPPANSTSDCDYNNLGIIGTLSDLNDVNFNLNSLLIDGEEVNYTKNYTGERTVEFREGNTNRIVFDYDFTKPSSLNLRTIHVTRQPNNYEYGYLIVDGINAEKTLYINRKSSSSSQVCVKDRASATIGSLTNLCTGTNEYKVNCPGTNGNFSCEPANNNTFEVSGLRNSLVAEWFTSGGGTPGGTPGGSPGGSPICTSSWYCTDWSSCSNNLQTRTCSDTNNCNTTIGKPPESQSCSSQTLTNTNTNAGTSSGTSSKSLSNTAIAVIIILFILIILTIIIVLLLLSRKSKTNFQGGNDYTPRYQVTSGPPTGPPRPPMMPRFQQAQSQPRQMSPPSRF